MDTKNGGRALADPKTAARQTPVMVRKLFIKYAKALFVLGCRRSDLPRLPDVILQIGAFDGERQCAPRSAGRKRNTPRLT